MLLVNDDLPLDRESFFFGDRTRSDSVSGLSISPVKPARHQQMFVRYRTSLLQLHCTQQ